MLIRGAGTQSMAASTVWMAASPRLVVNGCPRRVKQIGLDVGPVRCRHAQRRADPRRPLAQPAQAQFGEADRIGFEIGDAPDPLRDREAAGAEPRLIPREGGERWRDAIGQRDRRIEALRFAPLDERPRPPCRRRLAIHPRCGVTPAERHQKIVQQRRRHLAEARGGTGEVADAGDVDLAADRSHGARQHRPVADEGEARQPRPPICNRS